MHLNNSMSIFILTLCRLILNKLTSSFLICIVHLILSKMLDNKNRTEDLFLDGLILNVFYN